MISGEQAQDGTSEAAIRHDYANVNGIRLHYAESGSGNDLVILLHGFPEFWYSWRHQLIPLGRRFHVVAPDMRGYNLSEKPPRVEDYSIDVLVNDVIGLIDHFGATKAAIVGHDWGAGVAWAVAQKYPERVSKLAVLQVPPAAAWRANLTISQLLRSWYMFFFQLPRIPEWVIRKNNFKGLDGVFKEKVVRAGSFTDADVAAYRKALSQPGALTSAINYYRANVFRIMRGSKPAATSEPSTQTEIRKGRGVRVPTLFIFGEQDFAILPRTVRGVADYVDAPYSELRIADSGHWVQNEAVEEVNAALLEFLEIL
ncbi:MAG: alpha/beta hydrolase [Pyrinomonadaceae bacterium]|nr:alpha/beta hydrolase [Pyrinomonadaceae bacterium]